MSELDLVVTDDLYDLRELVRRSPDAASLRPIGLKEVVRGRGAVDTLCEIVTRAGVYAGESIIVLSDKTPKRYEGKGDVLKLVLKVLRKSFRITLLEIAPPNDGLVRADEATLTSTIASARLDAPRGLVSVGSGTVVDIGKVVAQRLGLPHVVIQTAASVNGFADDQSVLLVDGVKRTTPSRWPDALVIDPWVVAEAPLEMTRSGLGDQLSMFSAAADWCLASAVGFDKSYSSTPVAMMRRNLDLLVESASALGKGDHDAVDVLATSLTAGGVAMGVAGRTAPSSGTEHLISHLLEMRADALDVPGASHGSQVGAASVLASLLWERVRVRLASGDAVIDVTNLAARERVEGAFRSLDDSGAAAEECWNAYEKKSTWIREHLDNIQHVVQHWMAHDREIEALVKPAFFVAGTLCDARAPITFGQLDPAPSSSVVLWAVSNCHLMRDRFTVVDLAELIGAWKLDDVARLLDEQNRLAL
jgi:glycerol-1-phosphate dehydrogenase [NAD(P)+]